MDAQPHSVETSSYRTEMDALRKTITENVRRLLGLSDGESGVAKLIERGFSNGNAQRVLDGETDFQVSRIARLAKALGVEPWQLLVPQLDPESLPTLHEPSSRWPFRSIDQDAIANLVGSQAAAVEAGLQVVLATAGVSPRKRNGTTG